MIERLTRAALAGAVLLVALGLGWAACAHAQVPLGGITRTSRVPLHQHRDISNGGKVSALDLDWSADWTTATSGGPCTPACLSRDNYFTGGTNRFFYRVTAEGGLHADAIQELTPLVIDRYDATPWDGDQLILATSNDGADPYDVYYLDDWGRHHMADYSGGYRPITLYHNVTDTTKRVGITVAGLTGQRLQALQDASGTIALTSDIPTDYVTRTTAQTVTGTKLFDVGTYFRDSVSVAPTSDVVALSVQGASLSSSDLQSWRSDASGVMESVARLGVNGAGHFGDASGGGDALSLYNGSAGGGGFYGTYNVLNLTANRSWTMPDASGTVDLNSNTSTLSNKTLSTTGNSLRSSTAGTGVHFADNTSTTRRLYMILSSATGNNALDIRGSTTTYVFPNRTTPTMVMKTGTDVDLTSQSAAIGSTTLLSSPTAGLYRVSYYLACTTADATAGSITFDATATDDVGSVTNSSASRVLTATGRTSGEFVMYVASGNLTYTTTVTGAVNAARYALRVRVEAL